MMTFAWPSNSVEPRQDEGFVDDLVNMKMPEVQDWLCAGVYFMIIMIHDSIKTEI